MQVPSWVCSNVAVAETVMVPESSVTLPAAEGGEVTIPGLGQGEIRCRLLSYTRREGQPGAKPGAKLAELSPGLIIHCHGGGFVSQSPDSHEIYLRDWAKETDVPILSIDYSLAPEAPFPRPLDEIVLVYAWALNHLQLLGSTGEQICVAGDSAGGNLSLAMVLKCQALGIRAPDGAVIMYAPLLLDMVPSPSRLMSMMDPLIPLGFMLTCLDAYAGVNKIDQDEYGNESPLREERVRKTSSISEYIESNMSILKEIDILNGNEDDPLERPDSEESFVVIPHDEDFPASPKKESNDNTLSNNSTPPSPKGILKLKPSGSLPDSSGSCSPQEFSPQRPMDYVEEFLKRYNTTEKQVAKNQSCNDQLSIFDLPADLTYNLHRKCCQWSRACLDRMSTMVTDSRRLIQPHSGATIPAALPWYKPPEHHQVLSDKFKKMKILASNPFMSPYYASDAQLKKLPPLYILSLDYDPCLDDSVMLVRRLKKLKCPVQFNILTGLPHGFLNFAFFIKEANDGSKLCINMLKSALNIKCRVKL
ncbi:LIPE [Cordylochernes scorpioides]|uniref:LIPE n=1 Tax=Cordylochernes scorpioides TaxID=51811 RepID=A0ABY6LSK7_9ARAC|nr:LIPE [Cordylochernes scorpioides]